MNNTPAARYTAAAEAEDAKAAEIRAEAEKVLAYGDEETYSFRIRAAERHEDRAAAYRRSV